jgi:hypothetical protein
MTDEEWNDRFDAIEATIKAEGIATRRHMDVAAERLKTEMKVPSPEASKGNSSSASGALTTEVRGLAARLSS